MINDSCPFTPKGFDVGPFLVKSWSLETRLRYAVLLWNMSILTFLDASHVGGN